jgi:hypothetical protein
VINSYFPKREVKALEHGEFKTKKFFNHSLIKGASKIVRNMFSSN